MECTAHLQLSEPEIYKCHTVSVVLARKLENTAKLLQNFITTAVTCHVAHTHTQMIPLTLAFGSFSLMALAAAKEAVPAPMRT